jgi:hypothetical protein
MSGCTDFQILAMKTESEIHAQNIVIKKEF